MSLEPKIALAGCLMLFMSALVMAETAYVIDRIEVGIHVENDIESPIQELVVTGTELEVLQKGENFSQVKTLSGVTGWINNTYLIGEKPGISNTNANDSVMQSELETAKKEIEALRQQLSTSDDNEAAAQIKSMRLKIGELQAELTQLRIEKDNQQSNDELYERIAQVEQEKLELQTVIDELKNPAADMTLLQKLVSLFSKRNLLYFLILLTTGMILGAIIIDLVNRRRHGGFRV